MFDNVARARIAVLFIFESLPDYVLGAKLQCGENRGRGRLIFCGQKGRWQDVCAKE